MKEIAGQVHLRIEEHLFAEGVDLMPAIVAGEIDAAASAAEASIAGRAGGAPIYVVGGVVRGGARLVAAAGSGIASIEDLAGKRVGVARGGAQELLLLAELDQHGLGWSDQGGEPAGHTARLVYLPHAGLNQALGAHQIDAMSQSEPQAAQAIGRGIGVAFGPQGGRPYDTPVGEPVGTLVVTEKLYRERPAVAYRLVELLVMVTRAFQRDGALAERTVRQTLFKGQLDAQDFRDAMDNAAFSYDLTVGYIDATTRLMQKYGVGRMARPPTAADWVKLDLLARAKAELGAP
jgi:NitT/TauT family transport system substrate-binding protein